MSRRNTYLISWCLCVSITAILQLGFPAWSAGGTHWGFSTGWQREIGFWNVGIVAIICGVTLKGSAAVKAYAVQVLAVLSAFIGANHAREIFQNGPIYFHMVETTIYLIAILCGAALILTLTRGDKFGWMSNIG